MYSRNVQYEHEAGGGADRETIHDFGADVLSLIERSLRTGQGLDRQRLLDLAEQHDVLTWEEQ